tara:strand:+ start:289 stop:483 length:195 start_codon:yes stop_codon:yes gene_type:complete
VRFDSQVLIMALITGFAVDQSNSHHLFLEKVEYHHNGPPAITLFALVNNKMSASADSSLLINIL